MSEADFKGYFHAGVATAIGILIGYNLMRVVTEPNRKNAFNLTIYTPLLFYEWREAAGHWRETT